MRRKIIRLIEDRKLTAREAATLTGVSHSDLSRIRNGKLRPFSLDRPITILGNFDQEVTVNFDVRSRHAVAAPTLGV